MSVRYIYKAIQYGLTLLKSKYHTCNLKFYLCLNGVEFGNDIRCFNASPQLQINRNGILRLGNNITFNSFTDHSWFSNCKLLVLKGAKLTIDDFSGMNGAMIFCSQKISIGKYVKIGGGTRITDSNHHSLDYRIRKVCC